MNGAGVLRVEPIPLVAVRRRAGQADLPNVLRPAFDVLWKFIRARKLNVGRNVCVYHDGEINLEVGVELEGPFEPEGEIVRSATPGGPAATVTHFGPYPELGTAYRAITDWCAANGRTPRGASWEIYGHWLEEWNADSSKVRTDVFLQVGEGS